MPSALFALLALSIREKLAKREKIARTKIDLGNKLSDFPITNKQKPFPTPSLVCNSFIFIIFMYDDCVGAFED